MNRHVSVESRGLAIGALAAGIACALGAMVAVVVMALIQYEAGRIADPVFVRSSWQAVYESLSTPWAPLHARSTEIIVTLGAVCVIRAIARYPIVSLPIRRVHDSDDAF